MDTITINGAPRANAGKTAAKSDRNAGTIPCVMYGAGENVHFTTTADQLRDLIYTGEFKTVNVNVDGKSYKCILKEVQYHPVTDAVWHIDFLQLVNGRSIKVEVPLRFEGVSPGVRSGGKFIQKIRSVKIKTKPEFLVDEMKADISKMKLGQSLRVRDIVAVNGVEIINPIALPIATVTIPRGLKSALVDEEETVGESPAEA
ncbi:MAG: 50S ribosomal protein L25 [Bacteroidetes bacterium]|nr:50S ribosomal protein L25 [Bacteroidota bacterium]